eukprot:CAMPEP_0181222044 /NCGR_PEP_ID=MMETSP1096-20121128/29741_1 /TAXON_ID=156174 ORGANISM="Chrysochromulina ericina, Strain CCMP281" /NCGR_SAMPLE_ID=MMETSP1096 /ASSEMBLY_ACC=CAM_ASM_000453 /LENGTH=95 /DNA_ID=CAMNT_0023314749 /DNA_START=395 /DNA_END=679 /DNA_ORIENTATION=-
MGAKLGPQALSLSNWAYLWAMPRSSSSCILQLLPLGRSDGRGHPSQDTRSADVPGHPIRGRPRTPDQRTSQDTRSEDVPGHPIRGRRRTPDQRTS